QEPVELARVQDIKDLVEAPEHVTPSLPIIRDFERTPEPRQKAIIEYLIQVALDPSKPDLTRQNSVEMLRAVEPTILNSVKIAMGSILDQRAKRRPFDLAQMKVAAAGGITPYLKQRQVAAFFEEFSGRLQKIPYD